MLDLRMTADYAAKAQGVTVQAIHKKLKSKNLPYAKSHGRIYFGYETAKQLFEFNFQKRIIAFMNIKGGVGKTICAFEAAAGSCLYGSKNLLADFDLQANQTRDRLEVDASEVPVLIDCILENYSVEDSIVKIIPGLDLFPSRIDNCMLDAELMVKKIPLHKAIRDRFRPLLKIYDNIFFDCNPSFGSLFSAIALAVDEIIIPITPDKQSFAGLNITYKEIKKIEQQYGATIPIRVVFNLFNASKRTSYEQQEKLITDPIYAPLRYKTTINQSQDFANALDKGNESIFKTLRETQARNDMDSFIKEMLKVGAEE
jgi:chromosome partitioning protein